MLEAIALGIPSICTNCPAGGARETIEHGVNGFLIPVGDRNKLADLMKKVLTNEVLAKTIGNEGLKLREMISIEKITIKWIEVIGVFMN